MSSDVDGGAAPDEVTAADWARLLEDLEPATRGELERAVAEADMLTADPVDAVGEALEAGVLVEGGDAAGIPTLTLADDARADNAPADAPEPLAEPNRNQGSEAGENPPGKIHHSGDTPDGDDPAADGVGDSVTLVKDDETPQELGGEDDAESGNGGDEPLSRDTIRDHYRRVKRAIQPLGDLDGHPTIATNDKWGWYTEEPNTDPDTLEEWPKKRRPVDLSRAGDYETLAGRVERTLYAITSYKSAEGMAPDLARYADGWEHRSGENPNPNKEDLRAVAAWGDIDLADDLKGDRGDLDEATRKTAEATLQAYADEFAALYGGHDAVYMLDSVGGAYLLGAPEATLPIADTFDDDARTRILSAFIERSNAWLQEAEARVNERVDGAADVIQPDWANNHNRQYKAPLSLHGDHDAVVTPVDPEQVEYTLTSFDAVDDDLVDEAETWSKSVTSTDHTDRVDHLVAELWPDYYADADGWRDALETWVEDEREAEARKDELRRRETDETTDVDLEDGETVLTNDADRVGDAVGRLDVERVAEKTIVHRWTDRASGLTDRSGPGKRAFVPTWGSDANSGNANYVDLAGGYWHDSANSHTGGPEEMALIAKGELARGDRARGGKWVEGVEELRRLGFDLPVWTPDAETADDGRMPLWSLRRAARALGVVDTDELVEREGDDGGTYLDFPDTETRRRALEAVEDAGLTHGWDLDEEKNDTGDEKAETPRDLLELEVVVEPRNALKAAAAVEPRDLDADAHLPELKRDDVDDVAIAVALSEGWIDGPATWPDDGQYTEAYYRARDHYGAPLPKYLDNTTLEAREELVFSALDRVRPEHILDQIKSEVTVADPPGEAVAKLNPTWEESESGERIVAGYGRGFWCAKHSPDRPEGHRTFGPLQVVALENDLVDDEFTRPKGEAFKRAYTLLREKYGAPLPKWRATLLEHVAVLPSSVRLLDKDLSAAEGAYPLEEARRDTLDLLRDAVDVRDRAQLVTTLPGTGKTYGTAVVAGERPILYMTGRNGLKEQMDEYAAGVRADGEEYPDANPSVMHLPILAENTLPDEAIREGKAAIREQNRSLLKNPDELYEVVAPYLEDEPEDDRGETDENGLDLGAEESDVDLDRGTCPTAEGEHGEKWRVRMQVARAFSHTPAELHRRDVSVFGERLPCHRDGDCEYALAWEHARNNSIDLLIGDPQHANVDTATTYFEPRDGGEVRTQERAVVADEFLGESYFTEYGDRFMDHAVWLAEALVGIDNREALRDAGLAANTWVSKWLDGKGDDLVAVEDAIDALEAAGAVAEAATEAADALKNDLVDDVEGTTTANVDRLRSALATVADASPEDAGALEGAAEELATAWDRVQSDADRAYADGRRDEAGALYALAEALEDVNTNLRRAFDLLAGTDAPLLEVVADRLDALPVGGDLRALLENAVDAVCGDAPDMILEAAMTALRGGRDGCRELALFASDGYAHPNAWALLAGAIAEVDDTGVAEVTTESFAFDVEGDGGGRFKRLQQNGATIIADMNHHGALVVDPPEFTDASGGKCPVVGLDATGRPELWRLALGRDTERRDILDTDAERREFLRENVDLTVVQTSNRPHPYHGRPDGKNFQEDLELVRTVAKEYTGDVAGALDDKGPAVISTLKVLRFLEDELADHAGDVVNYENMKGSDSLGDHQVAVILGSCHYGDAAPEKWALVAGESAGRGDTRGATLDYGSETANAYLRYMREDHTMQAILRAGRNDETTVVFAHTSALRDDLPVDEEGALVSAHSRGTLAVAEAAADLRDGPFTAREVLEAIDGDERAVGLRQVQNVLADLREGGYLRTVEEGGPGRAYEYDLDEEPGLADVDLPELEGVTNPDQSEKSPKDTYYTWNFRSWSDETRGTGVIPSSPATIPANDTAAQLADGVEPPG